MRTTEFDFYLPSELIAQFPTKERSASRLLRLNGNNGMISNEQFVDICQFIDAGDLMIFNNTKVIKARLTGQKQSGGVIEALIERIIDDHHVLAHVRASRSPKPGARLIFANAFEAEVEAREDDLFLLRIDSTKPILELLDEYGTLPLPLILFMRQMNLMMSATKLYLLKIQAQLPHQPQAYTSMIA
jgi:S-adenosylmethionine:tRNA ribosyltransferase-isomerase